MTLTKSLAGLSGLAALLFSNTFAHASNITVNATDVIYAAGSQSSLASSVGGTVPASFSVSGDSSLTLSVTGTIVLNNGSGNNSNGADGAGAAASSSSSSGYGSISGITLPGAGDLVGVFLSAGGPSGPAPAALDFNIAGATSFTSLSPLIDQVFFIGDGLTGDGTGSTQTFYIPTGATEFYLGLSDACGYNGGPGCYGDNLGSYSVTVNPTGSSPSPTPEPPALVLFGSGLAFLAVGGSLRKYRMARHSA